MGNCTVGGCANKSRGTYCGSHQWRLYKHGDVLAHIPIGRMYGGRPKTLPGEPALPARFPPGSGTHPCPSCGSARLTLPWQPGEPLYRCCACSIDFTPATMDALSGAGVGA